MSANDDTKRRYIRDLRLRGLLFTSRLYWTKEDAEKNEYAIPGRVRANLWYLGSLLHNVSRMEKWIEAGQAERDFRVEIPLVTVKMFLEGKFHDTPEEIARIINEQTKNGTVLRAVLLSLPGDEPNKPSMRNSSTRKASTRKSHTLKEESDSKKNHKDNKNQQPANAGQPSIQPPLSEEFTLEPDTPETQLIFTKINQNQKANGRGGNARKFKSLEQKKKCLLAIVRLGPTFEEALSAGLEQGITDLKGITNWIAKYGTKQGVNGYGKQAKPKHQNPTEKLDPRNPSDWEKMVRST